MVNGQSRQSNNGNFGNITPFTAGEGTNDLNVHDKNMNLDTSSGDWGDQGINKRRQDVDNIIRFPGYKESSKYANRSEQGNVAPLEEEPSLQTESIVQMNNSKAQANDNKPATDSADEPTAAAKDKPSKNEIIEVDKIKHLMTDDLNNGEKLADGYDEARGTSKIYLDEKHGSDSNWKEQKAA